MSSLNEEVHGDRLDVDRNLETQMQENHGCIRRSWPVKFKSAGLKQRRGHGSRRVRMPGRSTLQWNRRQGIKTWEGVGEVDGQGLLRQVGR